MRKNLYPNGPLECQSVNKQPSELAPAITKVSRMPVHSLARVCGLVGVRFDGGGSGGCEPRQLSELLLFAVVI